MEIHIFVNGKPYNITNEFAIAVFTAKKYIAEHKAEKPLVEIIPQNPEVD